MVGQKGFRLGPINILDTTQAKAFSDFSTQP